MNLVPSRTLESFLLCWLLLLFVLFYFTGYFSFYDFSIIPHSSMIHHHVYPYGQSSILYFLPDLSQSGCDTFISTSHYFPMSCCYSCSCSCCTCCCCIISATDLRERFYFQAFFTLHLL